MEQNEQNEYPDEYYDTSDYGIDWLGTQDDLDFYLD